MDGASPQPRRARTSSSESCSAVSSSKSVQPSTWAAPARRREASAWGGIEGGVEDGGGDGGGDG
eukprot:CAMPEP_0185518148 /NCGR_PEP_ID=MMETSP1366-20130426/70757_1 /TAXON_ID=38817 /ORGANISM="Gephyrocapsa oceanica, Strain RCC1303" /LENGTH=63 /DNA_ID=CAMNT_0028129151 /DNA_START=22 /DNA_END=209 /DNA_ORIENTATION=-